MRLPEYHLIHYLKKLINFKFEIVLRNTILCLYNVIHEWYSRPYNCGFFVNLLVLYVIKKRVIKSKMIKFGKKGRIEKIAKFFSDCIVDLMSIFIN